MAKNENKSSIATKLAEIYGEISAMRREGKNSFHDYTYFTEDQLTATLRPKLASRNLVVLPNVTSVETKEITNSKGKPEQLTTVRMTHTIVDGDTGEQLECSSVGQGADPMDKGVYKALTGAMKYFLQKLFFITDQTDPEADQATDTRANGGVSKPAKEEKHTPTRKYEEETTKGNKASAADLNTLREFCTDEQIEEAFVLKLAKEGKLDSTAETLDDLKPGVLTKLLTLRKRIKERWALETKGVDKDRRMDSRQRSAEKAAAGKKPTPKQRQDAAEDEDQTRPDEREFIMAGSMSAEDYLDQEGVAWGEVQIHFGTKKGTALGDMEPEDVSWWVNNWTPKKFKGKWEEPTILLDAALCVAQKELVGG